MKRHCGGLFLVSLVTLSTELLLTRVFDVITTANLAYMVITCSIFAFGLAGIAATLVPLPDDGALGEFLSKGALLLGIALVSVRPVLNVIPFNLRDIFEQPAMQLLYFCLMYLVLIVPFFLAGGIIITLFARQAANIQRLYLWDLSGAAVGCFIIIPFLPLIGPGGLLVCAAALALFASALFSSSRNWSLATAIAGLVLLLTPFAFTAKYLEFVEHFDKREVWTAREAGQIEFTRWDPISKIDVIDLNNLEPPSSDQNVLASRKAKHFAYDGGSQSSLMFPFDGDFAKLREHVRLHGAIDNFNWLKVLASHYLKRDTDQRVLIIGSAAGQETKAALMYGASHVDGVEMVRAVVELGMGRYADYNGRLFHHPKVNIHIGEGRSWLRGDHTEYDIIQIYSNHTSSSVAAGSGAMHPSYLQTVEAYRQYFEHLSENGVLHINYLFYPRMLATAAQAWKEIGRQEFQRHVVVFEKGEYDLQPTVLIKMKPWTEGELAEVKQLFFEFPVSGDEPYQLVEDPLHSENSFLPQELYTCSLSPELLMKVPYRISPARDDKPYFAFLRKSFDTVAFDQNTLTPRSVANLLNGQRHGFVTRDTVHLLVTAVVSLFYAAVFVVLPLRLSEVGRARWRSKSISLTYFACLGAGFIIFELVSIHIFMQFIGFPLYTYSTVIFTLLFTAGLGSASSRRLKIAVTNRWWWPFVGIIISGVGLLLTHSAIFDHFLASSVVVRVGVSMGMLCPLGFFLGIPFPLGILAIQDEPSGAIAWAWGLNGLFTVVGGLLSVVLSVSLGFRLTLLAALCIYVVAFWLFSQIVYRQEQRHRGADLAVPN